MGSGHDHIALDWVRGEIEQTLLLARNALELYADDRNDPTQLNFCLNHLHQVTGTLKMVELNGVAQVSHEMEGLCVALRENTVNNDDEALETLMGSLLHLQNYIESTHDALEEVPPQLTPVLNDLKAAKGESFAAGAFSPILKPMRPNRTLRLTCECRMPRWSRICESCASAFNRLWQILFETRRRMSILIF